MPLEFEQLCFVFLGPRSIAKFNKLHLNHTGPTDIITYHHGEILICPQIASRQCKQHGNTFTRELLTYVVHGWLHLAGWNDKTPQQFQEMFEAQERILDAFGLDNLRSRKKLNADFRARMK